MNYRFCVADVSVMLGQVPVQLVRDRAYRVDDPVVTAYPHLFSTKPRVFTAFGVEVGQVEQATAAPGEKRTVRRG